MRSSLLGSVIVTEFQATEAYSSLDLTKAKYSISRLSMIEKENVIVRISPNNFIAHEKNKMSIMMKMKFTINIVTRGLTEKRCQRNGLCEATADLTHVRGNGYARNNIGTLGPDVFYAARAEGI
jgi:hypothetical protein